MHLSWVGTKHVTKITITSVFTYTLLYLGKVDSIASRHTSS